MGSLSSFLRGKYSEHAPLRFFVFSWAAAHTKESLLLFCNVVPKVSGGGGLGER